MRKREGTEGQRNLLGPRGAFLQYFSKCLEKVPWEKNPKDLHNSVAVTDRLNRDPALNNLL